MRFPGQSNRNRTRKPSSHNLSFTHLSNHRSYSRNISAHNVEFHLTGTCASKMVIGTPRGVNPMRSMSLHTAARIILQLSMGNGLPFLPYSSEFILVCEPNSWGPTLDLGATLLFNLELFSPRSSRNRNRVGCESAAQNVDSAVNDDSSE